MSIYDQDIHTFFPRKKFLWVSTMNVLVSQDINTVGDLLGKTEEELSGMYKVGPAMLRFIKDTLSEHGLYLRRFEQVQGGAA